MQIQLYDRDAHDIVCATISPLLDSQIESLCISWAAAFDRRHQAHEHDEDAWMWTSGAKNLLLLIHRHGMRSFVVMRDGVIEGIVLFGIDFRRSRTQPLHQLIYVNYLATAPWNRRDRCESGKLRGVGTSLVETARQVSLRSGCEGRLGLHSLEGSDGFYDRLGLQNYGPDAAHSGMNYFELSRTIDFKSAESQTPLAVSA